MSAAGRSDDAVVLRPDLVFVDTAALGVVLLLSGLLERPGVVERDDDDGDDDAGCHAKRWWSSGAR